MNNIIDQTRRWVETVIVKHNLCPFAGRELERGSIRYSVCETTGLSECMTHVLNEIRILDMDNAVETSLLIYTKDFSQFDAYLNFVDIANELLHEQGYEGVYQLASFHPEYCFAESDKTAPENYTNRSPYPMLHIIREASLEQALEKYPNPEVIPENNIRITQKLGLEKMQAMLQACYDIENDNK